MRPGFGGHIGGELGRRGMNVDVGDVDDVGVGIACQLGCQRAIQLKWRRHMYPVELLKLHQLGCRLRRLWLEGGGVVDDQRQIVMGTQHSDKAGHLPFQGEIRLHQLHPQIPQAGQLGPLAAITACHLPACGHQLFTQVKSQPTAAARYQCTHNFSFCQCLPTRGPAYQSPRHKPLAPSAVQGT